MTVCFIETSKEDKIVKIRRDEQGSFAEVVENDLNPGSFNLTNTIKSSVMAEAREEAKRSDVKLKNTKRMAARI